MQLPNKIIDYEESIIPKLLLVLDNIDENGVYVQNLYAKLENKFRSVNECVDALDALYVLNKIELKEDGTVHAI